MGVNVREWKGAWWIFVNHQGRRKAKRIGPGESGRKAALDAATKIQAKLALGDPLEAENQAPLLQEYATTWLRTYASVECKPRTQDLYDSMFKRHVLPYPWSVAVVGNPPGANSGASG